MTALPSFIREQADGVYVSIKLQPRAPRNEIAGILSDELKVRITAPPVDNAANEALLRFLAEKLNCSRPAVQWVRVQTSRHKTIRLQGISASYALAKLM